MKRHMFCTHGAKKADQVHKKSQDEYELEVSYQTFARSYHLLEKMWRKVELTGWTSQRLAVT